MDNNNADAFAASRPTTGRVDESASAQEREPLPPLFPYATPPAEATVAATQRTWLAPMTGGLVGGVIGAALLALVLLITGGLSDGGGTSEIREIVTAGDQTSASAVSRKVVPSIVTVDVGLANDEVTEPLGSGSGVVLSADGLIVTNHHVVTDADVYQVTFSNGRIYEAELVGSDRRTDLAVLRIEAGNLVPIELGSTESAEIGQVAIAVGSPLGLDGGPSVTVGVLSAFGRQVRTGATDVLFDMLQTDAPITEGSSGGALVDANGRLLGITSAIGISSAGAEGIGFAIPVELVTRITEEIIETGSVQHPFIGVELRTAFAENTDGSQTPSGAIVTDFVIDPSSARDAGIQVGDLITGYNGSTVVIPDDLISGLRNYRAGQEVTLSITRGSETLDIPVVLGVRPDDM